jgi:CMP/dCMP kinase
VNSVPIVTVDGPAGSGKTTLGRRLAIALGLPLIDTGLFYRGVTVAAVRAGIDAGDADRLVELAKRTRIQVNTEAGDLSWQLRVDGEDAGPLLRDPSHARLLGAVSRIPAIRAHLLGPQRLRAAKGGVAVGRDCGTVVFPEAVVKLYLEAAEAVREARRGAQLRGQGADVDAGTLNVEIGARDRNDAAAMRPAPDAVIIDTGRHDVEAMVEIALRHCAAAGLTVVEQRQ